MPETPPFHFLPPEWLAVVDSTNTLLRDRRPRPPSGTVVAAVSQVRGRGRMGNSWYSPPGTDLTFSFLWSGKADPALAGTFSLVCGLATADFLASLGLTPACKWPNDILIGNAKIVGILCEAAAIRPDVLELVAGIGLNVGKYPGRNAAVGRPVACLEDETGSPWSPGDALGPLLACLENRVNIWQRDGFAPMVGDYSAIMAGIGAEARVRTGSGIVQGVVTGIDAGGGLSVRTPEGRILIVSSVAALE